MSGFEIVGVVLGVLPLVIEGLESYEKGLDTLRAAWKYKNTVSDLITTFETAAARYRNSCEVLLGPLLLSSGDYVLLIEEPGGQTWERSDIKDQLQERLGSTCTTYIRLVHRLYKGLHKFATKMALDPNNNMRPPWLKDGKTNVKTQQQFFSSSNPLWRATKMAFENGNLEKLLNTIETDLFRLERLIESCSRAAPVRQEARKKSTKRSWQSIQTAARSLFTAISTNWSCKCPSHHAGFLKLNPPSQQTSNQDRDPHKFSLLVPNDAVSTPTQNAMQWCQLEVESYGLPQNISSSSVIQTHTTASRVGKQAVTFLVSAVSDLDLGNAAASAPTFDARVLKIRSLCDKLKQVHHSAPGPGFLEDQYWRHKVVVSRPQNHTGKKSDLVSITDMLSCMQQPTAMQHLVPTLSTPEKYRIALLVATAVLQLHQTPWLADTSTLGKACVIVPSTALQNSTHPPGTTPSRTTRDLYISEQSRATLPTFQRRFWIPNEDLFTLAILLLELSYHAPLASFKTSADLDQAGCDTLLTEHSIAARLADEIVLREPSRYSNAVRRCLYCQFDTSSRDMSESSLQEEFWRGVVEPLQELDAIFT